MSYRFLDGQAIADIVFEAESKTLNNLFISAAMAVTSTMVKDAQKLETRMTRQIDISAATVERLLYNFLEELIRFKDVEQIFFNRYNIQIDQSDEDWHLTACVEGDKIDLRRQKLAVDVKAVSLHHFRVEETARGWRAQAILDM